MKQFLNTYSKSHKAYNCIIIDDEPHVLFQISDYISAIEKLKLVASFLKPVDGINFMNSTATRIDFLFLDINMQVLNGIETASLLRDKVQFLIFITAYEKYAVEAFHVNCDAFLLKPISFEKLLNTVNLVLKKHHRLK